MSKENVKRRRKKLFTEPGKSIREKNLIENDQFYGKGPILVINTEKWQGLLEVLRRTKDVTVNQMNQRLAILYC